MYTLAVGAGVLYYFFGNSSKEMEIRFSSFQAKLHSAISSIRDESKADRSEMPLRVEDITFIETISKSEADKIIRDAVDTIDKAYNLGLGVNEEVNAKEETNQLLARFQETVLKYLQDEHNGDKREKLASDFGFSLGVFKEMDALRRWNVTKRGGMTFIVALACFTLAYPTFAPALALTLPIVAPIAIMLMAFVVLPAASYFSPQLFAQGSASTVFAIGGSAALAYALHELLLVTGGLWLSKQAYDSFNDRSEILSRILQNQNVKNTFQPIINQLIKSAQEFKFIPENPMVEAARDARPLRPR